MNMKTVLSFGILLFFMLHVDARIDFTSMAADFECGSCLEATRKAEKALNNLKMFEEVSALSNQVCQALPVDLEIQCLKTSGDYIQRTRLLLKEFFHEESLCNSTGLCLDETSFLDKSFQIDSFLTAQKCSIRIKKGKFPSCIHMPEKNGDPDG